MNTPPPGPKSGATPEQHTPLSAVAGSGPLRAAGSWLGKALGFLLLMALTFALFGLNPFVALRAVAEGAVGNSETGHLYALSESLVKMTPLLLTGLSVVVAWRAGMFSIGAEGQLLMGALAAMLLSRLHGLVNSGLLIFLMTAAGVAAGAFWGALAGWLRVRRNVQEVISTIMLNYIALYLVGAMVLGPLQEASHSGPESDLLPNDLLFARLIPAALANGVTPRLHSGVFLALLAAPLLTLFLYRMPAGFGLRVVGQNSEAARTARFPVDRIRVQAMALSGALSGLAGVVELLGVSTRLDANFSPGWGYTAIPVALLGGLHPVGTLFSALFFGALTAGTSNAERQVGVPAVIVNVVQAAAVLAIVGARAWRHRAAGGEVD